MAGAQPDRLLSGTSTTRLARSKTTAYLCTASHSLASSGGWSVNVHYRVLIFSNSPNLLFLLGYAVLGGLFGGAWYGTAKDLGKRQERHHVWGKRLSISACIGLIYGLSVGLYPFSGQLIDGLSQGIGIGLSSLLLQHLLTSPENSATQRWVFRFGLRC